jgi:hypothetical protein
MAGKYHFSLFRRTLQLKREEGRKEGRTFLVPLVIIIIIIIKVLLSQ